MSVIVTDRGFAPEDWTGQVRPLSELDQLQQGEGVEIAPADDVEALRPHLARIGMVRVLFPAFNDGRGFTHGRDLRDMGFTGRLRAGGRLIADQYAMARRSGFDEVEIDDATAERQPWPQWEARADWRAHDYQSRLRA
jgi:uncharacterized protein (DUF934 family)